MYTRRAFLGTTAATTLATTLTGNNEAAEGRKQKIAVVTTAWHFQSHAQHMVDRFLVGYPHEGEWHYPQCQVVAAYVDQTPDGDLSEQRAAEFGFQIYPTIDQALRQGTDKLAVDGVLLIAEHGEYPRNEKGQILYPRSEFFQQIVNVFKKDGRSVPVFNDKHLSYRFDLAKQMVDNAHQLSFPLMAGSSLPVTWRLPSVEMPANCRVREALMVGCGGSDAMDFHALEAMQCMLERRRGGETGVKSVQVVVGEQVWKTGKQGVWSRDLLEMALSRSNELQGISRTEAKPQDLTRSGQLQELVSDPVAYFIEYIDGTRATLLMLNGAVGDYTFAADLIDENQQAQEISTLFYLPPTPNVTYSAELMNRVENMLTTGKSQYPVERTLLVSGMLESCLNSKFHDGVTVSTPHLAVRYEPTSESQFARS
ncbi:MAG: hypothetical protein GY768_31930 [Planctomycetaceae bacterium]|nr:hypothetical protein [Planctomycetaceae bacterium]